MELRDLLNETGAIILGSATLHFTTSGRTKECMELTSKIVDLVNQAGTKPSVGLVSVSFVLNAILKEIPTGTVNAILKKAKEERDGKVEGKDGEHIHSGSAEATGVSDEPREEAPQEGSGGDVQQDTGNPPQSQ